jgi:peptidoglycan hydrolase FlgJ
MADPVSIFAPSQQSLGPLGKMRAQAEELEGVFLNTLMSQLFSSIETEGDFGGGFAEETWRSMQSEQYAAAMAETGGIGLADQLVSELMKLQEVKGAS